LKGVYETILLYEALMLRIIEELNPRCFI